MTRQELHQKHGPLIVQAAASIFAGRLVCAAQAGRIDSDFLMAILRTQGALAMQDAEELVRGHLAILEGES